jgi:ABC-2 type transport system ATP-binding protein
MEADAGSVELFGRTPGGGGPDALAGVAGFVEDPSFYPYLSGRANLELLSELDDGVPAGRIDEVLERVDLSHRGSDRVSGYSTGMKQRLGIAAALLRSPRLLMLDEPTAGLDPDGVRQVGDMVRELSAQGVALLMSSHQIGEIEDVCHGFTVLRSGRVVWSGTALELRDQAPASGYQLETSDDARALQIAERSDAVRAAPGERGGLALAVDAEDLDRLVLDLGAAGIAVRRLELTVSPLESMFFALTGEPGSGLTELPDPASVLDQALSGT